MLRLLRTLALFTLLPGLLGCDPNARNERLKQALTNYESGQFALAADQAEAAMADSNGRARDEAAYVAGISEYRQGNLNQADRFLSIAAESTDKQIAGRASAVLGTVKMDQDRPREAAPLFADAAESLDGEYGRQAAQHAATAYHRAGDPTSALKWSAKSAGIKGDRDVKPRPNAQSSSTTTVPQFPTTGVFALQVGAFRDRAHAEKAASEISSMLTQKGMGSARIIATTDERSQPLYLVQFGRFDSRTAAADTRQRIGRLSFIVAPLAGDG